ncbi:hypothetical protein [Hymenobacter arizonensis]|uniref:Uncharacterized protein n=1 Tax=Hymenobacter arizonensis TaxID=1227077 RepID=A0A1I5WMP9_HYMAR|nr:hypothetical protein [Hymenobacter arizonensis]SFQ21073.1 hypothetical protein SAMN04515668_1400 [Hymenobacter arizonensis]
MHNFQPTATLLKRTGFLLLLPLLMSCEDSLDDLYPKVQPVQVPAATQAGLNTFGCRVNGQVWEANNASTLAGKVITPTARYDQGELRIDAFRRLQVAGPVTNFHFSLSSVKGPGVYELGVSEAGNSAELKTANGLMNYVSDGQHTGTLTITRLDTTGAQAFVAGRFELQAAPRHGARRSAELPAEMQVTEGRFDIQLSR